MRKIIGRILLVSFSLLINLFLFAQDKQSPAMADTMRSNGKIYVVVAVCLTILFGLFIYVFILDRKITKLERTGNI